VHPGDVPDVPLLVDTDVLSWMALQEGRAAEFAALGAGHEGFISPVTLAEVRTFLAMGVLEPDRARVLRGVLASFTVLPIHIQDVVDRPDLPG
jgi:predicted nucleic acid-binding protein